MYELLDRSCSNPQLPFFSSQPRKDSCHPHQLVLSRLKIDISCTIANFSWGYQQQESWLQFFTQTASKNTLEITSLSSSKALYTIHSGLAVSICFHQLFRIISSLLPISLDKLARIHPTKLLPITIRILTAQEQIINLCLTRLWVGLIFLFTLRYL